VCGEADKDEKAVVMALTLPVRFRLRLRSTQRNLSKPLRQMYRLPSRSPQRPPRTSVFCYRSDRVDRDCEEVSIHERAFGDTVGAKGGARQNSLFPRDDHIESACRPRTASLDARKKRRYPQSPFSRRMSSRRERKVSAARGFKPSAGSLTLGPPKARPRELKVRL
jgi:hypothetical protein